MTTNVSSTWASTTVILFLKVTRRYKFTSCMISNTMDISRHASLAMGTSLIFQLRVSTPESFHFMVYKWSLSLLSLMGWTCGPQI
jgi:hypothetical protein